MTRAIWIDWLKQRQEEQEQFIDEVCEIAFGDSAKCVRFATGKPREFTKEEVLETVEFIQRLDKIYKNHEMLCILQCTSMYPITYSDVNLNVMQDYKDTTGLSVGYSDHTIGNYAANIAVALGSKILEVHFTDDKSREFRDHQLSITKDELINLRVNINKTLSLLGSKIKKPVQDIETSERIWEFRRACYLKIDCKKGDIISKDNLTTLRPLSGIDAREYDSLIGKKLLIDKEAFHALSFKDIK